MKVYHGTRTDHGVAVTVEEDGEARGLDPRRDLRDHSDDGFEWGIAAGGPAQLALALAADVLGDDQRAQEVYQRLKSRLVARLPDEGWVLTENRIRDAIEAIEQARQRTFP